ncbi:hypothetical protein JW872_00815 [Candidatus Babeliales bacterium]|nr:hypothetical protein [Candidatus Babeliales bacterium]
MMSCRYEALQDICAAYQTIQIPLVGFNGTQYYPVVTADDMGMYTLIPKIASFFSWTLDNTLKYFFNTITLCALLIGLVGLFLLYPSVKQRIISTITLLLIASMTSEPLDIYRIAPAITIGLLPFTTYLFAKQIRSKTTPAFLFFAGLIIGFGNTLRTHAGTPIFFFIAIMIIFEAISSRRKIIFCTLLLSGLAMSKLYFSHQYKLYTQYIEHHYPDTPCDQGTHIFWHAVYLGFGFLENQYHITFDDNLAKERVSKATHETIYPSEKSEHFLKNEVITLIKTNKKFVLYTLFSKIGILLLFLLAFANIGMLCALLPPYDWKTLAAWIVALAFSALPGMLVIPRENYMFGFITLACLFGLNYVNRRNNLLYSLLFIGIEAVACHILSIEQGLRLLLIYSLPFYCCLGLTILFLHFITKQVRLQ